MKSGIFILACLLLPFLGWGRQKVKLKDIKKFAATENYPEDIFLDTVSQKRAMVIVAHDDDDCAMSGTLLKLKQSGWKIIQLSLQHHPMKNGFLPGSLIYDSQLRICATEEYRYGKDSIRLTYMPIPYEWIDRQYATAMVSDTLLTFIHRFQPSVIFTLDDVKGGYGHPDHVFMSRLVLSLFLTKKIHPLRIYQSVFTPHMENAIVYTWLKSRDDKWGLPNPSISANKLYKITGMPVPTNQVTILEFAKEKMRYLKSYPKDVRNTLGKFLPYYQKFNAREYFGVFNREFFRIISPLNMDH